MSICAPIWSICSQCLGSSPTISFSTVIADAASDGMGRSFLFRLRIDFPASQKIGLRISGDRVAPLDGPFHVDLRHGTLLGQRMREHHDVATVEEIQEPELHVASVGAQLVDRVAK